MSQSALVFSGLTFYFGKNFTSKERSSLERLVTREGGKRSLVLNNKVSYAVLPASSANDSFDLLSARRHRVQTVTPAFLDECLKNKRLIESDGFQPASKPSPSSSRALSKDKTPSAQQVAFSLSNYERYSSLKDAPAFPHEKYEVLQQYSLIRPETKDNEVISLELHAGETDEAVLYRVWMWRGIYSASVSLDNGAKYLFPSSGSEAVKILEALVLEAQTEGFAQTAVSLFSSRANRPSPLSSSGSLDESVQAFVERIFSAASHLLSTVSKNPSSLIIAQVQSAEAILLSLEEELSRKQNDSLSIAKLSREYFSMLPRKGAPGVIDSFDKLDLESDLIQTLKDLMAMDEVIGDLSDVQTKLKALKTQIRPLTDRSSAEYARIEQAVRSSWKDDKSASSLRIKSIFEVNRPAEMEAFRFDLPNRVQLYHGSSVSNIVGILSRGLLLPRSVSATRKGNVPKRTDAGMLGAGLYFASAASASAKYAFAKDGRNSRFLLVADVALGNVYSFHEAQPQLTAPPDTAYQSVRGVSRLEDGHSQFEDEEFVVYDTRQQQLRYIIEFETDGDAATPLLATADKPFVSMAANARAPASLIVPTLLIPATAATAPARSTPPPPAPDTQAEKKRGADYGLRSSNGDAVPLQAVAIRGRVLDMVAEITLMQSYKNTSSTVLECKYVFAVEGTSAVYAFEAIIDGRRIVGKCKEKEQARQEYREAISTGKNAYMLEQVSETDENVMRISVGNLRPEAECLVKISYVTELAQEGGDVILRLPANVAPRVAAEKAAASQRAIRSISAGAGLSSLAGGLSLQLGIQCSQRLLRIESQSHAVKLKRTETCATVELQSANAGLSRDFVMRFSYESPHEPRMWLEQESAKAERCCALVSLYPQLPEGSADGAASNTEFVFVVDRSRSMGSHSALDQTREILHTFLRLLAKQSPTLRFNIIGFGSEAQSPLFVSSPQVSNSEAVGLANKYIASLSADMGGSDSWSALYQVILRHRFLSATERSSMAIVLLSDGELQHCDNTARYLREHVRKLALRLFCVGVGVNAARPPLRVLAHAGAGAAEFTGQTAVSIEAIVSKQIRRALQPALSDISLEWKHHDEGDGNEKKEGAAMSLRMQSPLHISSLFCGERLIVYAFVPISCVSVSLKALTASSDSSSGMYEMNTIVTASDLQIRRGSFLHRLAARSMVEQYDRGNYHTDGAVHELLRKRWQPELVKLSLRYGIVTQWTSFVAVDDVADPKEKQKQPTLAELAAEENVDALVDLPYEEEFKLADEFCAVERDWSFEQRSQYRKLTEAFESEQLSKDAALRETAHQNMLQLLRSMYRSKRVADQYERKNLTAFVWQVNEMLQRQLKATTETPAQAYLFKLMGDLKSALAVRTGVDSLAGQEIAEQARNLYEHAYNLGRSLPQFDPLRIDIFLTYSAFAGHILKDKNTSALLATTESAEIAKGAFDNAISELDNVSEETYKDSTLIMQLLRDNLTIWTSDVTEGATPETASGETPLPSTKTAQRGPQEGLSTVTKPTATAALGLLPANEEWKIPPSISNWKNPKGFTIALDKRLAANGVGLQQYAIDDKFAALSESLYIAEQKAREEVNKRQQITQQLTTAQSERGGDRVKAEEDAKEKWEKERDQRPRFKLAREFVQDQEKKEADAFCKEQEKHKRRLSKPDERLSPGHSEESRKQEIDHLEAELARLEAGTASIDRADGSKISFEEPANQIQEEVDEPLVANGAACLAIVGNQQYAAQSTSEDAPVIFRPPVSEFESQISLGQLEGELGSARMKLSEATARAQASIVSSDIPSGWRRTSTTETSADQQHISHHEDILSFAPKETPEQDVEIVLNNDESYFLEGLTAHRSSVNQSPIRIVKAPEGTLQRAAMTQSALSKERNNLGLDSNTPVRGSTILHDGKAFKVAEVATSKSGKHGSAKACLVLVDPTTGTTTETVIPQSQLSQLTRVSSTPSFADLQRSDGGFDLTEALCARVEVTMERCLSVLMMLGARSFGTRFFEIAKRLLATALVLAVLERANRVDLTQLITNAKRFIEDTDAEEFVSMQLEMRSSWLSEAHKVLAEESEHLM